jgi:DNA-directed RNA polymerase specialized sigma24 family protein
MPAPELLLHLPDRDRALIVRIYSGESYAEIAAADGVSVNALSQRVHKIRKRLNAIGAEQSTEAA